VKEVVTLQTAEKRLSTDVCAWTIELHRYIYSCRRRIREECHHADLT